MGGDILEKIWGWGRGRRRKWEKNSEVEVLEKCEKGRFVQAGSENIVAGGGGVVKVL